MSATPRRLFWCYNDSLKPAVGSMFLFPLIAFLLYLQGTIALGTFIAIAVVIVLPIALWIGRSVLSWVSIVQLHNRIGIPLKDAAEGFYVWQIQKKLNLRTCTTSGFQDLLNELRSHSPWQISP